MKKFGDYDEAREALQQGKLQVNLGTAAEPHWADVPKEHAVFFGRALEDYRRKPSHDNHLISYVVHEFDVDTEELKTHCFTQLDPLINFLWGKDMTTITVFKRCEVDGILDVVKLRRKLEAIS